MKKTKILVPLDVSEMSITFIDWIRKYFDRDDVEITLIHVSESIVADDAGDFQKKSNEVLDELSIQLNEYEVEKFLVAGYIPDEILKKAEEDNYDIILLTKSTKKGLVRMIGSVTSKVIKNAKTTVIVLPK